MEVFISPPEHLFLQICKKQVNLWPGYKSLTLYLHPVQQNHS